MEGTHFQHQNTPSLDRYENKFDLHGKLMAIIGGFVLVIGIFSFFQYKFSVFTKLPFFSQKLDKNVLAVYDIVPYTEIQTNLKYIFNNSAEVLNGMTIRGDVDADGSNVTLGEGTIIASNIIYSLIAGEGVTITPGQNPIISLENPGSAGVSSIENITGDVDLVAGSNISLSTDGNKITINASGSSTDTDTNTTYSAGEGLALTNTTFSVDFNGIGLQDYGSSNTTSGASVIGVYTSNFVNIAVGNSGSDLQTVLEAIDDELSVMGGGGIAAVGNITSGPAFTSGVPGSNLFVADTGWIGIGANAGRIYFDDNGTDSISFMNANVGIGTSSPQYTLDVAGNIRAGTEIYRGSVALGGTTGASVLGVDSTNIIYSSASNIQQTLEDLDTAINNFGVGGSGVWLDGGSYAYVNPSLVTYLGNNASGGTNKINGAYFADGSLISLGTDNDYRLTFNGNNLLLGDTSNTFLSVGDSGTTGNFDFNNGQFYIRGDGNVGIGTTELGSKLGVNGAVAIGNSYTNLSAPTNGLLVEGYVGIGTGDNVFSPLHVKMSDAYYTILSENTAGNAAFAGYSSGNNANAAYFETSATGGTDSTNISLASFGSANLNSLTSLDIASYIQSPSTIGSNYGVYIRDPVGSGTLTNNYGLYLENQTKGNFDYGIYIGGADNFAIYSGGGTNYFSGNVGIGTTGPNYKLDVAGNIRAGTDIYIGNISLGSTGGASILGINDSGLTHVSATTIQNAVQDLDAAISSVASGTSVSWTDAGTFLRPTANEYLGNMAVGGTGKLAGAYFTDNSLLSLGTDNDYRILFNGSNFILGDTSNTFLSIGDSGTTGNFNFNQNQFYLRGDGNIGVGTTNASQRLTVNGGNILHNAAGNPTLEGSLNTTGNSYGVYVSGNYSYLADYESGFHIIDISNPASPVLISTLDTSGLAFDVHVAGRYAYLADGTSGLHIIDVSNPTNPVIVGTLNTSGSAFGVYISGKYAYVADSTSGLQVIDINNPFNPVLVGTYNTPGDAFRVYASGKYAYVADQSGGLQIVDTSNPSSPTLAGTYPSSTTLDVYVSGKYAYVADWVSGFLILNVSNPASPTLTGSYIPPDFPNAIYVSGKYAYLANYTVGLQIVDITNPASPTLTGSYSTGNNGFDMFVSGKYAYMAANNAGLQIININGIETPSLYAGNIQTNDITTTENADIGNNLYVRNGLNVGTGGALFGGNVGIGASFDLSIGNIRLGATGGAALVGVNDAGLSFVSATTIQNAIADLDAAIGAVGTGDITAVGNIVTGDAFTSGAPGSNLFVADTGWIGVGGAAGRIYFDDAATDVIALMGANVGIGTSSITANMTLDVVGNIRAGTDIYKGSIALGQTGGADVLGVNVGEFANVGVGSSTVQDALDDLDAAISTIASGTSVAWTDGGNYLYPTSGEFIGVSSTAALGKINGFFLGDTSPIIFGKDNDFRMVHNSAGNLVIGDSANNFLSINDGGTAGNFAFNTDDLYVASSGRVGIGTATPQAAFDVRGDIFTDRWALSGTNLLIGGTVAGAGNLSGLYNTILGGIAFNNITSGHSNVGVGYQAGYSNTTGLQNVAIGIQSLYYNQSGQQNVAIGGIAGNGNVGSPSFSNNTLIGYGTGYSLTNNANGNTLLGHSAGDQITSGTGNIIIGYGIDAPSATGNNQLNIGNLIRGTLGIGATISGNATLGTSGGTHAHRIYGTITADTLYTTTVGVTNRDLYVDNTGVVGYVSSSERYKENINNLDNIDWLYNLRPVNYEYKNDATNTNQYGLIAEEVNNVNPLLVSYNEQGIPETVSYSMLVTPLLKAVQDQRNSLAALQNNFATLALPKIDSLVDNASFELLENNFGELEDKQMEQELAILDMQNQIADVRNKVDLLNPIASDEASITNLTDRVSFLEQMLFGKEASSSAELADLIENTNNYPDGEVLGLQDGKLTVEDLTVTGKTNLFELGVVGDMSIGQISVRGNEAAINSLGLPLEIQSEATQPIKLMAGKVVIDTEGNLIVQEEVTAKKYNIDTSNKEEKSAGSIIIKKGNTEIEVETNALTSSSLIFASPKKIPVAVATELIGKNKFILKLEEELSEDLEISWWIVN